MIETRVLIIADRYILMSRQEIRTMGIIFERVSLVLRAYKPARCLATDKIDGSTFSSRRFFSTFRSVS